MWAPTRSRGPQRHPGRRRRARLAARGRLGPGDVVVLDEQGYESVRRSVAHWSSAAVAPAPSIDPVAATTPQVVAPTGHLRPRSPRAGTGSPWSPTTSPRRPARCCRCGRCAPWPISRGAVVRRRGPRARPRPGAPSAPGADFWTGTWHKWGFAPRGTSALWVTGAERDADRAADHELEPRYAVSGAFDTHGTDDYSGWFALPAALAFWRDAGGPEIGVRGRAMLDEAFAVVDDAVRQTGLGRSDAPLPDRSAPCLRLVALPDGVADTEEKADVVYRALSAQQVEAQLVACGGRGWIRLSGAVYNEPADYERLADVLSTVLTGLCASGGRDVVGVDDPVGVALLGQEPLPVLGEVGVDGVAGDDRVEARGALVLSWGAAAGRAAGPPPGASRTSRRPGSRPRPRAGRRRSSRPWRPRAGRSRRAGTR